MNLGTMTGKGLATMLDHFNDNPRNDTHLKLGFVMTDGKSEDGDQLRENSVRLRKANVSLYAIGIGDINKEELDFIAGEENVFNVSSYDELHSVRQLIRRKVCQDVVETWGEFFKDLISKPEFYTPMSVIVIACILGTVVALVVIWRLGVLARRKMMLANLDAAKGQFDEKSELNRIYEPPTDPVAV